MCRESGAPRRRRRATASSSSPIPTARRQLVAAGTPELLAALRAVARDRDDLDLDRLLAVAVDAAVAAGAIVRDGFGAPQNVREKRPGDW